MVKTTVVTMFFNLKYLKDASNTTRDLDFYMNNGKATLQLRYPMVVFCDESTVDMIKKIRDDLGESVKTTYVVRKLMEYDFYSQNFEMIEEHRKKNPHYGSPEERNTTSYFLATMMKPICLRIAKQRNPYNTPYYAWVDFGCNHVLKNVAEYAPRMLDNPHPKISTCYIHYRTKEEISDVHNYLKHGGPCALASTCFTIETSYVDRFYNGMMEMFYMQLFNEIGHADEQTMTLCYNKYPDLFTIYNGDYYSVLTNYHTAQADLNSIKYHFIYNSINAKDFKLAKEAIARVLDYLNSKDESSLDAYELDIKQELTATYDHRCQ